MFCKNLKFSKLPKVRKTPCIARKLGSRGSAGLVGQKLAWIAGAGLHYTEGRELRWPAGCAGDLSLLEHGRTMCGIVGYIGSAEAHEFLLAGLRRLEYRGYDSAGLASVGPSGSLQVVKAAGRIENLAAKLKKQPLRGRIGIGHTRWATHGAATDTNAHPHVGGNQTVAIVHNGVIENYALLKERLQSEGYVFQSATDTEVVAHLIASCLERELARGTARGTRAAVPAPHFTSSTQPVAPRQVVALRRLGATPGNSRVPAELQELFLTTSPAGNALPAANSEPVPSVAPAAQALGTSLEPVEAVGGKYAPLVAALQAALAQLKGTYGLAVLFHHHPEVLFAARLGSPLVVGVGAGEHFVASDVSPLVGHTDKIVYLNDHELAVVTAESLKVLHRDAGRVEPSVEILAAENTVADLQDFPHYMLKEIFEQPDTLRNAMRGRLSIDEATAHFGGLNLTPQQLRQVERIMLTGCGTSYHAGLVGEYLIEELARIPVEVEYASELRYRNPPLDRNTLVFALSQSGETADTLAAVREMKRKGHTALGICNVVGSTIARETQGGIYLRAGAEIGVASTKAFTSQCLVLAMLALYLGRMRHLSFATGMRMIESLERLPDAMGRALECHEVVRQISAKYAGCNNFLYLGRLFNYPVALEGALKLKEISYIHAEGYPAAEMKHGPIALVDESTPSVFVVPRGFVYEKILSNMEEIRARGGPLIAIAEEGDRAVEDLADDVIYVPQVEEFLQPLVTVVPLQLLAYHIALLRGRDVDRPRNLAKSVTVE